ncbi:MAG: cytochrome b N-terminal domain-containing protein [Bryobacteraceae bacterium]
MLRNLIDFLESRTGLETAVRGFFTEEIPASAGWHQVMGSVALFCFMSQVFTGILLALNYAPSPGEAHNSVRYIMGEVTAGKLIRGLHHWGASMMIVVVALHMVQVLLWGAYKKPREATWLVGLVLLQLVLGFGLTGYLLPWDNRAYWGTMVTTQIAASAPGAGPYITRLLGAENGIGVVTFTRFYAAHVMLLPLATVGLIGLHVFLVRRHGVAPAAGDTAPKKHFFPGQVFKDTMAIFAAFAILFTLAVVAEAPLGRLADPTDTTYIPRPEWYFLFLFQTLKFFEGPLEIIGSIVLPGLAMTVLALLPFLDRGPLQKVTRRTTAIGAVALGAIAWGGLTLAAIKSTPKEAADQDRPEDPIAQWQTLTAEELAGIGYFRKESCLQCHQVAGKGTKVGPDLTRSASKRDAAWMLAHFREPQTVIPGSQMPPVQLSDAQLNTLASFLIKLTPANAEALSSAPDFAVEGAMVYQKFACGACHQANGAGMKLGPVLNGLSRRRQESWVKDHFADPKKLVPGSTMPPYRFNDRDMANIVRFLMALPLRPPER